MNLFVLALTGLAISIALFAVFWVIQYKIENSAIVDVFWGASVAVVGVYFSVFTTGNSTRRLIAAVLITLWAARLSWYLYQRWSSHAEDERYTALKVKWGNQAQIRMFRFYQMQGLGSYLFALPLLAIGISTAPLGWLDFAGIAIWIVSIGGEAVSDQQLANFKKDPSNRGEVCDQGLWRYSRHPNYFFEWLHWWSFVFLSLSTYWGLLTLLAPLMMWLFLNRVTGIPHTEKQAVKSRGEKYKQYQKTTNAFFPWFPRAPKLES